VVMTDSGHHQIEMLLPLDPTQTKCIGMQGKPTTATHIDDSK